MSSYATPHDPRFPWLSPRLRHPCTGAPILHEDPYLWYAGDPWPDCLAGHTPAVRGLWVLVYDLWTQRHQVRALRAVAGTPAARQPYLCLRHAHDALRTRTARAIPPRRPQPIPQDDHRREVPRDRAARLAREEEEDTAREAAQLAWDALAQHRTQAVAAAESAAADYHRPQWFRPLRLPPLTDSNEREEAELCQL